MPRTTIEADASGREEAPEAERPSAGAPYATFPGEGEMAARWRALDWAATPLGPVQAWSPRLRAAAELALDAALPMVLLWGSELVQLYNDGYRALMGGKHPAGLGQPTRECWPEVWHLNAPIYERVRAGESVLLEDALFPTTRSGTMDDAWFTLSYSPVRDEDGTVAGVLVTVAETTVQVRARGAREAERERLPAESEAAHRPVLLVGTNRDVAYEGEASAERARLLAELASERERLRSVVLHTPAPLALTEGPDHRFTLVNEAYKRVSGGGRDVTGLTPRTAFPELAGSGIHEVFDQVYATGEPWVGPETLVRFDRDGTGLMDTWFDLRFEPVRNAKGRVVGVLNLAVDVTEQVGARRAVEELLVQSERARAEAEAARVALAASEVQFRMLADAIPTLAWTAQADGYIDWYNARWYEYTGTTPEQMEGWGWRSVHDPAALPDVIARWQASIATGAVFEMTFPLRGADGQFRPFLTRIVPLRDASGRVVRWVGTNADVTSEREARAAAERAQAAAEAANRAKGEFLAVMSHELRTPLNAIGGYAELLELGIRGPITDAQRADLARIQASQKHLLGLINQVLNYTRVDAGAVRYDLAHVPLAEALVAAEVLVLPQAHARGLTLSIGDCPPGLVARADPDKLQQVLLNLLTNAVKFTEAGGELRVTCAEREAQVAILVADTGVGIAAEKLASIFEPFVQVDQGLTRPHEGVGLGLAISRELARGMGGDLAAESTPGVGSTFTLTLPRA
ncbi:MAG TPA: PAS domain-containing protein [Longimicrobium sp.]|nr:PAS domain-containing protein [Longimicrobium sp.]